MTRENGFTLWETTFAAGVFFVVILCAARLLYFTAQAGARLLIRQELQENARTAMDALTINIQMAEEWTLQKADNGLLVSLTLWEFDKEGSPLKPYNFMFNTNTVPHRLNFGSNANELAAYLHSIIIQPKGDYLFIELTTDNCVSGSPQITVQPVILRAAVSIKGKTKK